jgi:hypothetical protein
MIDLAGLLALVIPAVEVLQSLPGDPNGLESLVEDARNTPPEILGLYAGSAGASVGTVRWLIKRRAAAEAAQSAGTSISTSSTGTTEVATTASASGTKDKVAFTMPRFLPVSKGIRQVSHNEVHAIELGLVVGAIAVWLMSIGRTRVGTGIIIAFVAGSLGFKRYANKAFKTLRHEPWYGLLALVAGAGLGWVVFIEQPGAVPAFDPGGFL